MTWVLIIFIGMDWTSKNDANAVTSVPGFASMSQCLEAAASVRAGLSTGKKEVRSVCVAQGKN